MIWFVCGLNRLIYAGYRDHFPRGTEPTCDAKSMLAESYETLESFLHKMVPRLLMGYSAKPSSFQIVKDYFSCESLVV